MARKPAIHWRDIDGIVLLDKPAGVSSNHALQSVRRLLRAAKAGHTGSLDPLATGLLPICLGEATKIAGLLLGSRKAYATRLRLGRTTTTDDADGDVLVERPVPALDIERIRDELRALTGNLVQVPPIYSAIKRDGETMYARARRGEVVDVPPRDVQVFRNELIAIDGEELDLKIECGSGTYVRSLVRDLGERLGCGAHVVTLRRLWVEPFREPVMSTLTQIEAIAAGDPAALGDILLPLEVGLAHFPRVVVDAADETRLRNGLSIEVAHPPGFVVAVSASEGHAIALAQSDSDGRVRPQRGFSPTRRT